MQINSMQVSFGPNIYYDPVFRNVLEDHMSFLRTHPGTKILNIEPIYAYKYEGDLSGLLTQYRIDVKLHWIIMRMNNYYSFSENNENLSSLIIPDGDSIERIRESHKTVQNKIKT